MQLFKISEAIQTAILSGTDLETGQLTEGAARKLNELEMAFNEKVVNIVAFIKNLEGDQAALKEQADHFAARAKSVSNKITWLKDYLQNEMKCVGLRKAGDLIHEAQIMNNTQPAMRTTGPVPAESISDLMLKVLADEASLTRTGDTTLEGMVGPWKIKFELSTTAMKNGEKDQKNWPELKCVTFEKGTHLRIK